MMRSTREAMPFIVLAYCILAAVFGLFAFADWGMIDREWWIDLAVATLIVFGFLIPVLGGDLRKPKVLFVLALLYTGHMTFCLHFLKEGVYLRPLAYAPIGVAEVFISVFALMRLGGASLDDYRESLSRRRRK
jgi:hypothetical protein